MSRPSAMQVMQAVMMTIEEEKLSRVDAFEHFLDSKPSIPGKTEAQVAEHLESMPIGAFVRTLTQLIMDEFSAPSRSRLAHVSSLETVVELIRNAKKVLVLTGAGISTSCGIPDFRSATGVYSLLGEYDLQDPQDLFSISYFKRNVKPFYDFAKRLWPGTHKPAPTHRFIRALEENGCLLRNYTQNIDTLEHVAGISNVLQCHGSFSTATCTRCKYQCKGEAIQEDILNGHIPRCPQCKLSPMPSLIQADAMQSLSSGIANRSSSSAGGFNALASDDDDDDVTVSACLGNEATESTEVSDIYGGAVSRESFSIIAEETQHEMSRIEGGEAGLKATTTTTTNSDYKNNNNKKKNERSMETPTKPKKKSLSSHSPFSAAAAHVSHSNFATGDGDHDDASPCSDDASRFVASPDASSPTLLPQPKRPCVDGMLTSAKLATSANDNDAVSTVAKDATSSHPNGTASIDHEKSSSSSPTNNNNNNNNNIANNPNPIQSGNNNNNNNNAKNNEESSTAAAASISPTPPPGTPSSRRSVLPAVDELFDAGVMKPDIVFFGESLPSNFFDSIRQDVDECDLLLVMGTSLHVAPVSKMIEMVAVDVPQVLINREVVARPHSFDVELLGNCDQATLALGEMLGWDVARGSTMEAKLSDGQQQETGAETADMQTNKIEFVRCEEPKRHRYLFEGHVVDDSDDSDGDNDDDDGVDINDGHVDVCIDESHSSADVDVDMLQQ